MKNKINGYDTIIRDLKVAGFRYILQFEYTDDAYVLKNSVIDALRKKKIDTSFLDLEKESIFDKNAWNDNDKFASRLYHNADKIVDNIDDLGNLFRDRESHDILKAGIYGKIGEALHELYNATYNYFRNCKERTPEVNEYINFHNEVINKKLADEDYYWTVAYMEDEDKERYEGLANIDLNSYIAITKYSIPYIVENNNDLGSKKIKAVLDEYLPFI